LAQVARNLKRELNGRAFLTIARTDVTRELREVSGEDTTRIKSQIAEDLELVLLQQGVRCFPSLQETTTGDTIRLFHAGTILGSLVDLLIYPAKDTDRDLGDMLKKIKGQWNWSTPTGPAALIEEDASRAENTAP
jgi:hypothetical protein